MSIRLSQSTIADNKINFRAHHVAKLNRKDLEDQYYQIYEDNVQLKINLNKLNKELKLFRVKLQRFTQYQKRNGKPLPELIEEQSFKIYALERINKNLNEKIEILEQNLLIHSIDKHTLINKYEEKMTLDIDDRKKIKSKHILGHENEEENFQNTSVIPQNNYKEIENRIGNLEKEIKKGRLKSKSMRDQEVQSEKTNFALENEYTKAYVCSNCSLLDRAKKIEEIFDTSDILSKQLAEEQMKVLELQRQLKGEKISQEVIMEIQNRMDELKNRFQESNSEKSELNRTKIKCKELEIEVIESKKTIQTLQDSNNNFQSQMLNMQINTDMLKLKAVNQSNQMIDASVDSSDLEIETNIKIKDKELITPTELKKDSVKFEAQSKSSTLQEFDGNNFDKHVVENEAKNMIVFNSDKMKSSQNVKISIKESEQDDILIVETDENMSDINKNNCPQEQLNENSQKEILYDDSSSIGTYKKFSIQEKLKSAETTSNQDSSDEYLSDGEVKENAHSMHFEYNSEVSHDSSLENKNIEKNNNGITHEQITEKTKSTIKLISKEMEKCKSLLNLTEE